MTQSARSASAPFSVSSRGADGLRDAGALVAQPEELDHLVRVLVGLDRLRDPAGLRQDVVRLRAAGLDEHVANRALERQVGEPVAVQVPELALAEPELDAAEAVRVDGHALPARDLALDPCAGASTRDLSFRDVLFRTRRSPGPPVKSLLRRASERPETGVAASLRGCRRP